jgi:hypothetical protein
MSMFLHPHHWHGDTATPKANSPLNSASVVADVLIQI